MKFTINHRSFIRPAAQIAKQAHAGQFRRDGVTPYFTHPNDVARRVQVLFPPADDAEREALIDAAFLHDVLEDSATALEDLLDAGISWDTAAPVIRLTRTPEETYKEYLRQVKSHPIARKVKIADMISNLADAPTEKQILKYAKALQFLLS